MKDLGLVWGRGGLVWGYRHGFGRTWMPGWLKRAIVLVVNRLMCVWRGHDRVLERIPGELDLRGGFPCTMCGTRLRGR